MNNTSEIFSLHLPPFILNLIIMGAAIILGFIIKLIITFSLNYYKNKKLTDYSLLKSILVHVGKPLNHFLPLLVLNIAMPLMVMHESLYFLLSKTVLILLIISLARVLIASFDVLEDYIYHIYDLKKTDNLHERKITTQLQFLRKLIVFIILLIAISAVLLTFDRVREIGTGLLAGVGIGGIIIGFAAQKSLGNLLAGLQIAFTQPIRIDDVLVVEGEWGRVEEITLTYVVINIWDQRRLILPITYFTEKPFQNWTRTGSELLGTVFLYMDYSIPVDDLRNEFTRLLEASSLWDKRVNVVHVTDTKEFTMEVRFLMSAQDSGTAFNLRCYIRENLIKYIQTHYADSLPKYRLSFEKEKAAQA